MCIRDSSRTILREPMQHDDHTGIWAATFEKDLSGYYYTYLVEVFVPGAGMVRNLSLIHI